MSALHEQERGADGVLRCTCQKHRLPTDSVAAEGQELVGTLDAWRRNAALHNAMRREIERVATFAAAHERTHEWISDRLIEILDDPKAWMEPEPRTWRLPDEPGSEVAAVRDGAGDLWARHEDGCWAWTRDRLGGELCAVPTGAPHLPWSDLLARGPLADATNEQPGPTALDRYIEDVGTFVDGLKATGWQETAPDATDST